MRFIEQRGDLAGFLHFCNLSATFDDAYQAGFENQQLPVLVPSENTVSPAP
jgi:hypothetical protein